MESTHFTYSESLTEDTLCQGDLLEKTDNLKSVLQSYHSYYALEKYTHFIVLTQSCDLTRRQPGDPCKSRYISLAAVRNLNDVLTREMYGKYKATTIGDSTCCSESNKTKAKEFLKRLLNNNHPDYFFLKSSTANGLPHDSCAFLHLSIAVKAREHYEKCLEAKCLELTENFRAKLGWLVGQLYSRIGTEDYVPGAVGSTKELDQYLDDVLQENIVWIPSAKYQYIKKAAKDCSNLKILEEAATEDLKRAKESKFENLATRMIKEIGSIDASCKDELVAFLSSDAGIKILKSTTS